ncbi:hypothetical protein BH20ACT9_BH20ACT9_13250 [soil metagenome]
MFDLGGSGGSDVSRHKDDYVGEAFEDLAVYRFGPRRDRALTVVP